MLEWHDLAIRLCWWIHPYPTVEFRTPIGRWPSA